jgi:4-amino-4-deoxy-L-arabinose transferase-like glycosyltransferase
MLRKSWTLGAAAAFGTVVWFALLAQRPLYDPDEGRYAEIPREMLDGGDWVIPRLNALAYLEKPPLQYWLTALAYRGFGQNEFAARLCTGVAGYLSLVAVFLLGRELWGFDAGLRALLFTSASTLFVLLGHQLTLDMLLSFCLTAALACLLLAQVRRDASGYWRYWMLGCWAAMALAVLAKGLIGVLIPVVSLGLYLTWERDWVLLRRLNLRWGLPLFAIIAVPWFALAARANTHFLTFFFIREHFQRYLTPIAHRTQPWWFFAPVLAVGITPWLPQAATALASTFAQRAPRGQFNAARLLWMWSMFVLIFFSLSDSKLVTYIPPAVPALALLCAGRKDADDRAGLMAGALLSLASCVALAAYMGGLWSSAESQELLSLIRPVLFGTCALWAAGALICAGCVLRGKPMAALAGLCIAWFLATATILVAANAAQSLYSGKELASALRREIAVGGAAGAAAAGSAAVRTGVPVAVPAAAPTGVPAAALTGAPAAVPIFAVQTYQQSWPFYLQRPVVLVGYRDEFDFGLTQDPRRGIATLKQFAEVWLPLSGGYAVMGPSTRDRLSAAGVPMREIARFPERVVVSRR